jgi:hypothetical protein
VAKKRGGQNNAYHTPLCRAREDERCHIRRLEKKTKMDTKKLHALPPAPVGEPVRIKVVLDPDVRVADGGLDVWGDGM